MYGYIFLTENLTNGKKFIGKYASVNFDRKHFGMNPGVLSDIEKLGDSKFTVKMIRACETKPEYEAAYTAMLEQYGALSDSNFYNCEKVEPEVVTENKPKRSRKKKVVE